MNVTHTELTTVNNHAPQIFDNFEFGSLEIVMIDSKPYFPATECAKILGYADAPKAIRVHCKGVTKMGTPSKGGTQEKNFIPEGDLYRLIARSKLPAAERFERWVFDDVLPTIRAYGGYGIAEQINKFPIPKTFPEALRLAADLQEKNETLESKIEEDKPKVNFANSLLDTKTCIPALDLSKILYQNGVDIGQHRLYTWLRENGYFIKKGDSKNLPTHKAMKLGLFKISEKAWFNKATQQAEISRKTLVTPKGQMYFINKFISGKAKYTT